MRQLINGLRRPVGKHCQALYDFLYDDSGFPFVVVTTHTMSKKTWKRVFPGIWRNKSGPLESLATIYNIIGPGVCRSRASIRSARSEIRQNNKLEITL